MKAVESSLPKFLEGSKQFIIPIYQRTYSWHRSHCEQLWNDILKMTKNPSIAGHFIGSIVYISKGLYTTTEVAKLLVIDGQQRLTTIMLLLKALANKFKEIEGEESKTAKKIHSKFIFNNEEEAEERYKLILTQSDKPTFISIVNESSLPKEASAKVKENFDFFSTQINKFDDDYDLLYGAILKLLVVDVSLNREYDNPQLIFESLNSTGLDLSQADLIRNFILMGQEQSLQERLYNNYWYPMEQQFDFDKDGKYFDRFMRDYLTIKLGRIPTMRDVYKEFKKYYIGIVNNGVEKIVADIKYYAEIFVKMSLYNTGEKKIDEIFRDIDELQVEVSFPFLLQVYRDWLNDEITKEDFKSIIAAIESYVFRRAIVGIPTNSLNKTFANLYKEIDKENYLESFYAAMQLKDSYRKFPTDDEFKRELMLKDVYNFRSRNYLLRKLENYNRKEKVDVQNYTIEHILPQNKNLSKEWKDMLGENWSDIQKEYLHTIGNLTLTGYNPELSDKPFTEKRDMEGGFRDSPIRLNRDIAELEKWTKEEIIDRAKSIAEKSVKVWPFDTLPENILEKYKKNEDEEKEELTIEQFDEYLQNELGDIFDEINKRTLNLDASVKRNIRVRTITYKNAMTFLRIIPQKHQLRIALNIDFEKLKDPDNRCRDITEVGKWGTVETSINSKDNIESIMYLINQAFEEHSEKNTL